jgi:protocatechuate 3,4-dioxygenase alpha subunit
MINLTIFARGLLNHLVTRIYFADEPSNAEDITLQCVPEERRATLLASREEPAGAVIYCFDIVLQGEKETAFFNL